MDNPNTHSMRRILFIAADKEVTTTLAGMAEGVACPFTSVALASDAVALLEKQPFHLVMIDGDLLAGETLTLLKTLRETWHTIDMVVLATTGTDFPYMEAMAAGASDIIAKPLNPDELRARTIRIFDEQQMRNALLLAEKKYRSIFEYNADGMLLLDRESGIIVASNQAFTLVTGYEQESLLGKPVIDLILDSERDRYDQGVELCGKSGQGTLGDITILDTSGNHLLIDISVTFFSVFDEHWICLAFKDVTEKRLLEQSLSDAAQKDDLTSLWNQKTFHLHLQYAIAQARSSQMPLSLIMFDVDNFKKCNDTHGHPAGDAVLHLVGECINKNIRRQGDEGFRCGGDEFAVILCGADLRVAAEIGERIRQSFAKHNNTHGTTLSAGIAAFSPSMHSAALTQAADAALYRSKNSGKNALTTS